jgi:flagellar biosynthesis/type III secretory pathway M-ring protein FliF/YscJ
VNTAVVALLAVVALGMMIMMVRKSSRPIELPTPEELVGIPPALHADSDLVGEADESDAPMPGIELGDDEIKRAKLLEQVAEMVKQNPETAASLLSRWIETAH